MVLYCAGGGVKVKVGVISSGCSGRLTLAFGAGDGGEQKGVWATDLID